MCGGVLFPEEGGATGKAEQEELGVAGGGLGMGFNGEPCSDTERRGQRSGWHVCGRGPQGVAAVWPGGQNPRTRSLLVSNALRKRCLAGGAQPRRRMAWEMAGAEVSPACTARTVCSTPTQTSGRDRWASSPQPDSVCPTVPARDPASCSSKMQRGTRVAAPSYQAEAESEAGSPVSPWTPHLHSCWE